MTSVAEPIAAAGPGAGPAVDDRALLRAHEPVLRFTAGELFLPTSVGRYVAQCSLWTGGPRRSAAPLVAAGLLTLDRLSPSSASGFATGRCTCGWSSSRCSKAVKNPLPRARGRAMQDPG